MTALWGTCRDSEANRAADETPSPRSSVTRRAFSSSQIARLVDTSARWSTGFEGRAAARSSLARRRAVTAMSPSTGTVTEWNRPSASGSLLDLHDRLVGRDAGMVRERRPEDAQHVGLVHHPRR